MLRPRLLLPALLLLAAGCLGPGWRHAPWPFLYETPPEGPRLTLYPIFSTGWNDETGFTAVHPLFYWESAPGHRELDFLYPLGFCRADEDDFQFRLFPLFSARRHRHDDGRLDADYLLTPLLLWGFDEEEGDYFSFFPVYGHVNGLFGRDELTYVLFPLYSSWRRGRRESRTILWPFYRQTDGPGYRLRRIFPFYIRETQAGRYDYLTVLWPFFRHGRDGLNTDHPATTLDFFPFFGQQRGEDLHRLSLLWPFFEYLDTPDESRLYLRPFYGRRVTADTDYTFFLWPLGSHFRETGADSVKTRFYFLPFFWAFNREYAAGGREATYRVWPLFGYHRTRAGECRWGIPAPQFTERRQDRFRRNFAPLWDVARYRRSPGYESLALLWGLYYEERHPTASYHRLFPLYAWQEDEERAELSLFAGALRLVADSRRTGLSLFFLPRFPTW